MHDPKLKGRLLAIRAPHDCGHAACPGPENKRRLEDAIKDLADSKQGQSQAASVATKLVDLDGNEYYDLTSGMMCMVLGHSHPELTEVIREMAGAFLHESSWYSNPWVVEFAELPADVHPFFVGTQAHPELKSRPTRPHPLFAAFVKAALDYRLADRLPLPEPAGAAQ